MLDLDDFKPVNDTYGHDAGDWVLQIVAQRLQETLRKTDFVARLGGDEFVLLVENLDHLDILDAILDKVVAAIHLPMILEGGQTVSISLSMGVSIYPWAEDGNLDALLRVADQALYENKAHYHAIKRTPMVNLIQSVGRPSAVAELLTDGTASICGDNH